MIQRVNGVIIINEKKIYTRKDFLELTSHEKKIVSEFRRNLMPENNDKRTKKRTDNFHNFVLVKG